MLYRKGLKPMVSGLSFRLKTQKILQRVDCIYKKRWHSVSCFYPKTLSFNPFTRRDPMNKYALMLAAVGLIAAAPAYYAFQAQAEEAAAPAATEGAAAAVDCAAIPEGQEKPAECADAAAPSAGEAAPAPEAAH